MEVHDHTENGVGMLNVSLVKTCTVLCCTPDDSHTESPHKCALSV